MICRFQPYACVDNKLGKSNCGFSIPHQSLSDIAVVIIIIICWNLLYGISSLWYVNRNENNIHLQ